MPEFVGSMHCVESSSFRTALGFAWNAFAIQLQPEQIRFSQCRDPPAAAQLITLRYVRISAKSSTVQGMK